MKERETEGRMDRMIHRRRYEQEETREGSNEIERNDAKWIDEQMMDIQINDRKKGMEGGRTNRKMKVKMESKEGGRMNAQMDGKKARNKEG